MTQFDAFALLGRFSQALSTSSRLRLLDRVVQGEQTVEQLAAAAGLSVPNASRQLRLLAESGLVRARREPPFVFYRVAHEEVARFWLSFRDVARARLPEVDRAMSDLREARDPLQSVGRDELIERMRQGAVVLIDVRPTPEYRAGHLPGALSVPLDDLERLLPDIPRGRPVVAYCRGPLCVLAADAVGVLRANGWDARRFEDGVPEWRAAGLPVEAA